MLTVRIWLRLTAEERRRVWRLAGGLDVTNEFFLSAAVLLCASSQIALADQNGLVTGAVGGAVAGAVVGGPVGAVVGGVGGAAIGNSVTNHRSYHRGYAYHHHHHYEQY